MTAPILIFATGNESRGDDALAPLLLRKLAAWLETEGDGAGAGVELIEEFQLQVEHVMDMAGRRLILFIDAGMAAPAPYIFYRARAGGSRTLYSHSLTPESLLAVYPRIHRKAPPPAFVLCIRGEQFELGAPLSPQAEQRMESAMGFMRELLREAQAANWEGRCTTPAYNTDF